MLAARFDPNERDLANLFYAPEPRLKLTRKTMLAITCVLAGYGAMGVYLAAQKWVAPLLPDYIEEHLSMNTVPPPQPPKAKLDEPPPPAPPPPMNTPPEVVQHNTPDLPLTAPDPTPYEAPKVPTPPTQGPAYALLTPTPPLPTNPPARTVPSQILNPDWINRPTAYQANAAFPSRAMRLGVSGRAELVCTVQVSGTVAACQVVSETPGSYGFGAAALTMAPYFKMKPRTVDGLPVEGARVRIPVEFTPGA